MEIFPRYPGNAIASLSGSIKNLSCYIDNRLIAIDNSYVDHRIPISDPFRARREPSPCYMCEQTDATRRSKIAYNPLRSQFVQAYRVDIVLSWFGFR